MHRQVANTICKSKQRMQENRQNTLLERFFLRYVMERACVEEIFKLLTEDEARQLCIYTSNPPTFHNTHQDLSFIHIAQINEGNNQVSQSHISHPMLCNRRLAKPPSYIGRIEIELPTYYVRRLARISWRLDCISTRPEFLSQSAERLP